MKRFIFTVLFLCLPFLICNLFLYINNWDKTISLTNYYLRDWHKATKDGYNWVDTVIIGSSLAQTSIDPSIIQKTYKKNGRMITIESLATPAESTSSDYYMLKRILTTCRKCPKDIIYVATQLALKDHEIFQWPETSFSRFYDFYFVNDENDELLKKAGKIDPNYKAYQQLFSLVKPIRFYLYRKQLLSLIELFTSTQYISKGNLMDAFKYTSSYKSSDYGFHSSKFIIDDFRKQSTMGWYTTGLKGYKTGGATDLYLANFLQLAKQYKIKMHVIIPPVIPEYRKTFKNELGIMKTDIKRLCSLYSCEVIDDADYFLNEEKYFADNNHLNINGAKLYSVHISKKLMGTQN